MARGTPFCTGAEPAPLLRIGLGLTGFGDCLRVAVEFMAGQRVARHGTWKPATETSLLGVWKQLSSNLSSLPAQLDRHLDKMKNKGSEGV